MSFGLFLSEAILFIAVILLGLAAGWRGYLVAAERRRRAEDQDTEALRAALTEAQTRRTQR
jgi:hypothetical protein